LSTGAILAGMTKRQAAAEEKLPLYMQLVKDVREQIKDGALAPGDQVGPARVLAEKHGVSIITAQKALGELQSIGLVHAIPGKGSYVDVEAIDNLPASEPYTVRQNSIILQHHDRLIMHEARLDDHEAAMKLIGKRMMEEIVRLETRIEELEARAGVPAPEADEPRRKPAVPRKPKQPPS
jgi:DNA-binding GntR family transcriptional regulator